MTAIRAVASHCRQCQGPVTFHVPVTDRWITESATCKDCGYINVFESGYLSIPLQQAVHESPGTHTRSIDVPSSANGDEVTDYLWQYVNASTQDLKNHVDANAAVARTVVLPLLDMVNLLVAQTSDDDDDARTVRSTRARAIQLLVVLVEDHGGPLLDPGEFTLQQRHAFVGEFSAAASNAAMIAMQIPSIQRGHLFATIEDGLLVVEPTPLHTQLQEWELARQANQDQAARSPLAEEIFPPESQQAERLLMGFCRDDVVQLLRNNCAPLFSHCEQATPIPETSLWLVTPPADDPRLRRILDLSAYTRARVNQFLNPFYWDLGTLADSRDDALLRAKALFYNWFGYYPLIPLGNAESPSYALGKELFAASLAISELFTGRLLDRVATVARERDDVADAVTGQIESLKSAVSKRMESKMLSIAHRLGWAAVSFDKLHGELLPGGEIDFLAAKWIENCLVIVLGEVKDWDLTVHKMGAEQKLAKKVRDAFRQLDRKSADVKEHWRAILTEQTELPVQDAERVVLTTCLITAEMVPPYLLDGYPGVEASVLAYALRQIADELPRMLETVPERFTQLV